MAAPDAPKTQDPMAQLAQVLTALLQPTLSRVAELEAKEAARDARPAAVVPEKRAWEERVMVRALRDCTYPNKDDPTQYAIYRKGKTEEYAGDVFPLMYREHLIGADHLEEVGASEQPSMPTRVIPQTAARGVRPIQNNGW